MERLYKELLKLKKDGPYPFHMPGHKRNENISFLSDAYGIDITEIDNFDNLHDANGIIKEAEENAARLYGSNETHFLVNGSTCGILAAIFSVTKKGDKIIVARNCHKSVYNAIQLNELNPIYVYPDVIGKEKLLGSIDASKIEEAIINNPDVKAVIITSPTYDGILSDVASIAKKAHEFDIPLIVDEAHGALLFIEGRSAVINGADIVINSVHKTLPALTQTALIHVNGGLCNREKLREYLSIFQTSSPSYVLMASIDYAMDLLEGEGNVLYRDYCVRTVALKEKLRKLRHLRLITRDELSLFDIFDFDEGKIIISTEETKMSGKELSHILLEKYNIQSEMSCSNYILLMSTLMDTMDGINLLIDSLLEIDDRISECSLCEDICYSESQINKLREIKKIIGLKSDRTIYVYPPGVPVIVKGEILSEEDYLEIETAIKTGLDVKGL